MEKGRGFKKRAPFFFLAHKERNEPGGFGYSEEGEREVSLGEGVGAIKC